MRVKLNMKIPLQKTLPAQDELVSGDDGTTVEFESGVSILTRLPQLGGVLQKSLRALGHPDENSETCLASLLEMDL